MLFFFTDLSRITAEASDTRGSSFKSDMTHCVIRGCMYCATCRKYPDHCGRVPEETGRSWARVTPYLSCHFPHSTTQLLGRRLENHISKTDWLIYLKLTAKTPVCFKTLHLNHPRVEKYAAMDTLWHLCTRSSFVLCSMKYLHVQSWFPDYVSWIET